MIRRRFRRPSPALVISLIALFVALGGTGYSARNVLATHKDKKADTKLVHKLAPSLSVKHAKTAGSALTAASADTATNALHARTADSATSASSATNATNAINATKATNATNADNATLLGGFSPFDFLFFGEVQADGSATSTPINHFTSSTYTDVVSNTFTAPENGFVLVVATLSAKDDTSFVGAGQLNYQLALDGGALASDPSAHQLDSDSTTGVVGASGAVTAVIPVTAGTHTLSLQAKEVGTGDVIEGREISVLFVPTGNGVVTPYTPKQGRLGSPAR